MSKCRRARHGAFAVGALARTVPVMAVAALVISIIAVLVGGWYGRKQARHAARSADAAETAADASKVAAEASRELAAIESIRLRADLAPQWSGVIRRTENSGVELRLTLAEGSAVGAFELEIVSQDVRFIGSHTTGSPSDPARVRTYPPMRVGDRIVAELAIAPEAPDPIHFDTRANGDGMEWEVPLHLRKPRPGNPRAGRAVSS